MFFDEIDAIGGARFDDGAGEAPQVPAVSASKPQPVSATKTLLGVAEVHLVKQSKLGRNMYQSEEHVICL